MLSDLICLYNTFLKYPRIITDSRKITQGSIFFALRGDHFNGNEFTAAAFEKGAEAAVVDEPAYMINDQCFLVEDVLKALQELATYHRKKLDIPVIAVTGTNGKTTTKELTGAVLSKKFNLVCTEGNLNNHIGVPLTLMRLNKETQIAVIEMGANHPGEIDFLCNIAHPSFGIITNAGKAHLEGFGSFEGVVRTKTELYRFLSARHGKIFVNYDDPLLMELSEGLYRITYGLHEKAWLSGTSSLRDEMVSVSVKPGNGEAFQVHSGLFGAYNALNILAAVCIGRYFKVDDQDACSAIEAYRPSNNRSQVKSTGRNLLIMDAYNANPSSMEAALRSFSRSSYRNRCLILGDMLELGSESDAEHSRILSLIEALGFEDVYLVGPVFASLNSRREYLCFNDSELALLWLSHHPPSGRTILLKGSRGIKLETVIDAL
jgi:UDP-N-acetylmuramoyl-tripeptide--D-alanyl-D-alanine ligase